MRRSPFGRPRSTALPHFPPQRQAARRGVVRDPGLDLRLLARGKDVVHRRRAEHERRPPRAYLFQLDVVEPHRALGPVVEQQVKLNVGRSRRQLHHVEAVASSNRKCRTGRRPRPSGTNPAIGRPHKRSSPPPPPCRERSRHWTTSDRGRLPRLGHEADAVFLGRIDLGSGDDAHLAGPAGGRNPQGPLSRVPHLFVHGDGSLLAA